MDRLELHVSHGGFLERRRAHGIVVEKAFERRHALFDAIRRRRNKVRVSRTRAPDPDLGAPKLARRPVGTAPLRQKNFVNLAQEAVREREVRSQSLEAVFERRDVAGYLRDVVERYPRNLLEFEEKQVGKGRLRPLYLRREDSRFMDSFP